MAPGVKINEEGQMYVEGCNYRLVFSASFVIHTMNKR